MRRALLVATAMAALAMALGSACHEHFEDPPMPDLYKHVENFGFDLTATTDDDLSVSNSPDLLEDHHDLATKLDSN
jgi:hypothetical protein